MPSNFGNQCGSSTSVFRTVTPTRCEIATHHGFELTTPTSTHVSRATLIKSFVHCFANEIFFRSKVEIEAAVCEASSLHQVGNTRSLETLLAKAFGCRFKNPLPRCIEMSL